MTREGIHGIGGMARINGVAERVVVRGMCGVAELSDDLARATQAGPALVFMDVEGGEKDILDPVSVPQLAACDVLVELHDFVHAGVTETIRSRFRDSHRIVDILARKRTRDDLPDAVRSRTTMFSDRCIGALISERCPEGMRWFHMEPANRSA